MVQPADDWDFGGVDLQNDTLRIRAIQGYSNVPAVVGGGIKLISTHGERFFKRLHGARKMSFTIDLYSHIEDPILIHQNLDALAKVFGVTANELQLVHHHPDGTDRIGYGICIAWNPADTSEVGNLYVGTADIMMSDPYFYRADIDTGTLSVGTSPFTWNVTHPGTARGMHMTYHIVGPSSSSTIWLFNTSIASPGPYILLTLGAPLASGHTIDIDTKAFACYLDGVSTPGILSHGSYPPGGLPTYYEFMFLDPGVNTMRVDGLIGGTIRHIFSPPFL